jgi:NAD(P)H-quinone oxidoreductase subunit 5
MFDLTDWICLLVAGAPTGLFLWLGLCSLLDRVPSERATATAVRVALGCGSVALLTLVVVMWSGRVPRLTLALGHWLSLPHYDFTVKLLFDWLAIPFTLLAYMLCITVGAFALRYMHREPGYNRFFVMYAMFMVGVMITALAGTIEVLFAGWELVGLSSALLVSFFHERAAPVYNGLHIWSVYRASDAALLVAAVLLHHWSGTGDFDVLLGRQPWPHGQTPLAGVHATIVGLLFLVAAAGKSGLVPFSGWLPRAMEGPTPSSAVFYGALSIHLGAFLLLRAGPIVQRSLWVAAAVTLLGLLTAVHATLTGRVQTDIKSALAYASLTQVGIIVVEIGLGLRWVALVHIIGHVCVRTLQFLRAPSLLHDRHQLENALGAHLHGPLDSLGGARVSPVNAWLYRLALERGYLDAFLTLYVVEPLLSVFRWCDRLERHWTTFLSGRRQHRARDIAPTGIDTV